MNHFGAACLALALASGQALAQPVQLFEKGAGLRDIECPTLKDQFTGAPSRTACFPPRTGVALRCVEVRPESVGEFCRQVQAHLDKGGLDRVAAIGVDITRGFTRAGGRRADQESCPFGLPQDELLLPAGRLRIDPGAISASELLGITLIEEGRGGAPAASFASVGKDGATLEAEALRGRKWVLRGRAGSSAFACRFSVISAAEAQGLVDQFKSLQQNGAAGQLEQAAFFRSNQFWYEYWRVIDSLRRS